MTKKKTAAESKEISEKQPGAQVTRTMKEWNLRSMVKDDDIVPEIMKGQADGWNVFQILPSGSYYSILFNRN